MHTTNNDIQAKQVKSSSPLLLLFTCILLFFALPQKAAAQKQPAKAVFNQAANLYIADQKKEALQTLERGLRQYPNDPKLQALHQKLTQQQKQEQPNQNQEQQEQNKRKQSQQQQKSSAGEQSEEDLNQQGQNKDQPSEQQKKDTQEQQQRESADGEGKEQEVQQIDPRGDVEKRLQEMNISPEKAKMILEAMKSKEIQYLQQKQRQPSRRQRSNKPDW